VKTATHIRISEDNRHQVQELISQKKGIEWTTLLIPLTVACVAIIALLILL